VTRWRLFLEEFAPKFQFIKGSDNSIADALSRLPRADEDNDDVETVSVSELFNSAVTSAPMPRQEEGVRKRLPRNNDAKNSGQQQKRQRSEEPRRLNGTGQHTDVANGMAPSMDCLVALPENFPPVSPERPYPLDFNTQTWQMAWLHQWIVW
jgi:hypothetical protein